MCRLHPKEEVKPLSIAPLANTDWRALARQKKELYKPSRSQDPSLSSSAAGNQQPEIIGQAVTTFGLQVPTTRTEEASTSRVDQTMESTTTITTTATTSITRQEESVKSLEAQAIDAIIQGKLPFKVCTLNPYLLFYPSKQNLLKAMMYKVVRL